MNGFSKAEAKPKSQPTVVIVEDDAEVRNSLRLLFLSQRFSVGTFASAEDFLDGFDPAATGCLLLDERLPNMSGLALLKRLAENNVQLPTIVITAYGDRQFTEKARKAGATEVVHKPVDPEALVKRVTELLELHR